MGMTSSALAIPTSVESTCETINNILRHTLLLFYVQQLFPTAKILQAEDNTKQKRFRTIGNDVHDM